MEDTWALSGEPLVASLPFLQELSRVPVDQLGWCLSCVWQGGLGRLGQEPGLGSLNMCVPWEVFLRAG